MSDQMRYSRAVIALGELAIALDERSQRIYEAHQAGVPKAEIARITGLSWQTIDRTIRDMAARNGREG